MQTLKNRLLERPWWQQVFIVAFTAIIYVYIVGFLIGIVLLPTLRGWGTGIPPLKDFVPSDVPALFVRWDSGYYMDITERGYTPQGDERAFFPLYPVLVRMVHLVLGTSILWSGFLVSVSAFVGAGLFLYKWIQADYGPDQALLATIWMYIFPMAFFFVAFYGEPLLLLASIASMYFARRSQFVASGLAIAFAGASRGTAFLLGVPFIIEFWQQRDFTRTKWAQFLLGASIAPVGTLAYLAFLSLSGCGNLSITCASATTSHWQTFYTWPWSSLWDGLKAGVFGTAINSDWFSRALVWNDLFYGVLGLALGLWSMRSMRFSAAAFLFVGMIFLLTVHGPYGYALWSTPRRVAVLYPVYPAIAIIMCRWPPLYRRSAVLVSLIMLGLFSAWFANGRWVA